MISGLGASGGSYDFIPVDLNGDGKVSKEEMIPVPRPDNAGDENGQDQASKQNPPLADNNMNMDDFMRQMMQMSQDQLG